jgi:hypothetical protein
MILKNECESFLKNTTKTAWTRSCNLAGNEQELPEDDALVLKHVGVINKEQYNKLSIKCAFACSLYIYLLCCNILLWLWTRTGHLNISIYGQVLQLLLPCYGNTLIWIYPQSQFAVTGQFSTQPTGEEWKFIQVTMSAGQLSPPSKKLHKELAMWKQRHGLYHGRNI